jgi:hypothetical protein
MCFEPTWCIKIYRNFKRSSWKISWNIYTLIHYTKAQNVIWNLYYCIHGTIYNDKHDAHQTNRLRSIKDKSVTWRRVPSFYVCLYGKQIVVLPNVAKWNKTLLDPRLAPNHIYWNLKIKWIFFAFSHLFGVIFLKRWFLAYYLCFFGIKLRDNFICRL